MKPDPMGSGRIVAIDHGTKRTGVAYSDTSRVFAFPGEVFLDEAALLDYLKGLHERDGIAAVVVGMPYNMDGTEGERARDVRAFCERLEQVLGLPVATWDERLTSVEAESMLAGCRKRGAAGKAQVDLVAAQIILRGYLAALAKSG